MRKRALALFLAFVLILPVTANSAAEGKIIYVRAESLFDFTSCRVELFESDGSYYISDDGIHSITGFSVGGAGNKKLISGSKIKMEIDFGKTASREYEGKVWYALEDAMNKVQVYILSNGDGVLYFNSPWSNLDSLLSEIDNIMTKSYFSANMLEDMGLLADSANVVANIYDIVTNCRVNALWGGAYEEDISKQIMTLLLPMDESSNVFSDIKSVNGKVNKAAKTILKLENAYEDVREYLYDIPAGGDVLLFGIEGTELLRESAEAIHVANGADFADLFLRARLGYAGMKDFEATLGELKGNYLTDVHAFNLGDLISVGEYIVDTTRISSEYALALDDVLQRDSNSNRGVWSKYKREVIKAQSEKVLSNYKAYMRQNYLSMFGGTVSDVFTSISSNVIEDATEKLLMGRGSLWSSLFVTALNFCTKTDKKTDAVRKMYMLGDIQSLFKDCYSSACAEGIGPDDAVFCKGTALLYLKTAWQAIDGFSFDTPTTKIKSSIEQSMSAIRSYPDEIFSIVETKETFPTGTFSEVDNSRQLEIICRPDVKSSQMDSVVELPVDYEKWYVPRYFEIRDKETHDSIMIFWLPFDKDSVDWFYPPDEVEIIVNSGDYLVFGIWSGPGEYYTFSYNSRDNKLTPLKSGYMYSLNDKFLLNTPITYDVNDTSRYLHLLSLDGELIYKLIDECALLSFSSSENYVYYCFAEPSVEENQTNNVFYIRQYNLDSRQDSLAFSHVCRSIKSIDSLDDKWLMLLEYEMEELALDLYSPDGHFIDRIVESDYTIWSCISGESIFYATITSSSPEKVFEVWQYQPATGQQTFILSRDCLGIDEIGDGYIKYSMDSYGKDTRTAYW